MRLCDELRESKVLELQLRGLCTLSSWAVWQLRTTRAELSAGIVQVANSLQTVATLTVDKYGPTVCKIMRQLNTINSLRIGIFNIL